MICVDSLKDHSHLNNLFLSVRVVVETFARSVPCRLPVVWDGSCLALWKVIKRNWNTGGKKSCSYTNFEAYL